MQRAKIWIGLFAVLPFLAYGGTPQEIHTRIQRLEKAVLAPCCYTETVAQHQSEIAVKMRVEIAKWVEDGRKDEEILDTYSNRYGAKVLVDPNTLGCLLVAFLKIGSIGFGGGMAVIALMEQEFVRRRCLIPLDEFVHSVGLGQVLGSFAVNVAIFIGYREQVILQLAVFAGMRPGELLAIQREHVKPDASVIEIRRRVYKGKFATPKNGLVRIIAVPPDTASQLRGWMKAAVDQNPDAFVFAGETGQPLWRSSMLEDHIRAKLEPLGLGWVNFQVMRRTHASLAVP